MDKVLIAMMVGYLQDMEHEADFSPWDDKEHAARNLMTVFNCQPDEAHEAVEQAKVSYAETQEARQ